MRNEGVVSLVMDVVFIVVLVGLGLLTTYFAR